jgi:hypothetical protein
MKIFGHPWIEHEPLYKITNQAEIKETPPNTLLKIDHFDIKLLKYCQQNNLAYMVSIGSIKEAIFANIYQAKYVHCSKSLAKEIMPIAQNYLFDTQVIATIDEEKEIEEMAKANVDGVWFK